jgi:hypothetical protein
MLSEEAGVKGKLGAPTLHQSRVHISNAVNYESNPKHKHPWQPGRRGSLCPVEITPEIAQQLLSGSILNGRTRWACWNGRAFCAREHLNASWHGYPVGWREVPPAVRLQMMEVGILSRRDVRTNW